MPHRPLPPAVLALALTACASVPPGGDPEAARRTAEEYLHRVGAGDARGACDLALARDGRTPLVRDAGQHGQCVELYRLRFEADAARTYTSLKDAVVTRAVVQGNHASISRADTRGADVLVRNDRTLALLLVDGRWYVGSDESPAAGASR